MSRVPYLDVMTIRPSQAAYRDVSVLSSSSSISGFQGNKNVFIPEQVDNKLLNQIIDNQTKMLQLINNISQKQDKLENTLITIVKNSNTRTSQEYNMVIKPLQGPKVIQINSETLKIHKVYDTIIELLNTDPHINRNSLKRAIEKKSIYRNYRWMFINRDSDIKEIVVEPILEKVKERSGNTSASINAAKSSLETLNTTGSAIRNKTIKLRNKAGKLGSSAYKLGKTVKNLFSSS
jgi:hypothetical protein